MAVLKLQCDTVFNTIATPERVPYSCSLLPAEILSGYTLYRSHVAASAHSQMDESELHGRPNMVLSTRICGGALVCKV